VHGRITRQDTPHTHRTARVPRTPRVFLGSNRDDGIAARPQAGASGGAHAAPRGRAQSTIGMEGTVSLGRFEVSSGCCLVLEEEGSTTVSAPRQVEDPRGPVSQVGDRYTASRCRGQVYRHRQRVDA